MTHEQRCRYIASGQLIFHPKQVDGPCLVIFRDQLGPCDICPKRGKP